MAKRLYMTSVDYLAIALSPALIMALVGSLVFFLIDVLYVGQYQARLTYAFALFVFATVLIARISIEMGSERAVLFALPLGLVMFLFLMKFVEHPSGFSHVINLALLTIVWWCAHQLTWDSTVIDDDEDDSGEGLMQQIGVDGPEDADRNDTAANAADNELLEPVETGDSSSSWWQRLNPFHKGRHTPGVWVLYFSLAALPLFGIAQHWIPAVDVGRRRYAFGLLLVYVAAALMLLVSTSFLNLRRYLRQRRVEMPLSIAGTWVGTGVVIILLIMFLAALLPRPAAEVAISRVPWQVGSPDGLQASRYAVNRDGGEQPADETEATTGETMRDDGQPGNQLKPSDQTSEQGATEESKSSSEEGAREGESEGSSSSAEGKPSDEMSDASRDDQPSRSNDSQESSDGKDDGKPSSNTAESGAKKSDANADDQNKSANESENESESKADKSGSQNQPTQSQPSSPKNPLQNVTQQLGGLGGVLKLLFYLVAGLFAAYLAWRYRQHIMQALADILRAIRELFSGTTKSQSGHEEEASAQKIHLRSFSEFRDPFAGGQHTSLPPEELVRYTFAAFEAWANDRGSPRSPDCTPQELVRLVTEPETPLHREARRLAGLYSQVAYASQRIPREAANELRTMWQIMRAAGTGSN